MKRLNSKGYMLVEIILAFALAMVIMYFIMELTIKVKNRNDDLLVRTLTSTDQAIIYNMIMGDVFNDSPVPYDSTQAKCEKKSGQKNFVFTYRTKKTILNEYVDSCSVSENTIEITVNALTNDNFDVVIH